METFQDILLFRLHSLGLNFEGKKAATKTCVIHRNCIILLLSLTLEKEIKV